MKIQVISKGITDILCDAPETISVEKTKLDNPLGLDQFDLNIIDASSDELWVYAGLKPVLINDYKDFITLNRMISTASKSLILIILPRNIEFSYNCDNFLGDYFNFIPLKDMTSDFFRILKQLFGLDVGIEYERLRHESLNGIESDFRFVNPRSYGNNASAYQMLTCADHDNKCVTVKHTSKRLYITTLQLHSYDDFQAYFRSIGEFQEEASVIPEWFKDVKMFDDDLQQAIIADEKQKIDDAKKKIAQADHILEHNNHLKSILYNQSDELVDVVTEILEDIFQVDTSNFNDEKEEDLRFKHSGIVYILEIKGTEKSVKKDNLSQLNSHLNKFLYENKEKKAKAILIINYHRSKPITDRGPVPEGQIKLAERNGSLIIDTYTLLKVYELVINGKVSREVVTEVIKEKTGLLTIDDLDLSME